MIFKFPVAIDVLEWKAEIHKTSYMHNIKHDQMKLLEY